MLRSSRCPVRMIFSRMKTPTEGPLIQHVNGSGCGQGSTDDELSPTCVSSLLGIQIRDIAAGLWHTICTSVDGDIYAFGGNQFGQLGTGTDQAETIPKLLDAQCLENKNAKVVSCGARHSAMLTEDGKVFCWGWNKYGQ
ncbi:hypothetical protein Taro_019307, partial [Colocasia esculenta]|nr:hypothetical protein [Colocasia esculenta]